jgi:hypothetical protein
METAYPLPGDDMIDPWGNSIRVFPKTQSGVDYLLYISELKGEVELTVIKDARRYIESRTLDIPVKQLDKVIQEILDEKE